MNRADVDDDSQNTCSRGLHACASSYLGNFYSNSPDARVVVVKVDPKDVVSVPYDYNFSKMRVCRYEVLADVTPQEIEKISKSSYYNVEGKPKTVAPAPMYETWWKSLSPMRKEIVIGAFNSWNAEYKWKKSNKERRVRIWMENK